MPSLNKLPNVGRKTPAQPNPEKNLGQWFLFPDILPNRRFGGFVNRDDVTQNRGVFPLGQNVSLIGPSLPTLRQGYEAIGTEGASANPITRGWLFENRNGVQFELRVTGTVIEYWLWDVSTDWATLLSGLTAGTTWSFANIGKSSDATNHCLFNNGTDSFYRFDGAYATVSAAGANTLTIASSTWTALGFYTTGTRSVIINGTVYSYTGGEGTDTLTGVTPDPNGVVTAGSLAVQSPQAVAALATHLSSLLFAHDGRLHSRLETKKTIWEYSKLDDPFDYTSGSSDGDGGAKDVELGGPITAYGKLNKSILCFKKRLVKVLDFIQFGTRLDSPRYQTLTSTDDRGTTFGAVSQKATFSTPAGMIFVTPDKRLVLLTGVTANNEPMYSVLSEPIQSVMQRGVHTDGAGICIDNLVYYAFKENEDSASNDTVIVGDLTKITPDLNGNPVPIQWDLPYIGWNVSDWTAVYNSTTGRNEAHFHSSLSNSTYKVIDDKTDLTGPFTATVRTWAEHFDFPQHEKLADYIYVEIRMNQNSSVLVTALFDEDGVTQQQEWTITGDDTANQFNNTTYNPFGASSFGSMKLGSSPSNDTIPKYRYYLPIKANTYFFNISLQLSSDGENSNFELVRFGYRLQQVKTNPRRLLMKGQT